MAEEFHNISDQNSSIFYMHDTPLFKYGTGAIAIFVALLIVLSFIIKYPDKVNTAIQISPETEPVYLNAKTNSVIEHVFVKDNQKVNNNDTLIVLQSGASYYDVQQVKSDLKAIQDQIDLNDGFSHFDFQQTLHTGNISQSYSALIKTVETYCQYKQNSAYEKRKLMLQKVSNKQKQYIQNLQDQYNILLEVNKLVQKEYQRDSQLFASHTIAEEQFDNAFQKLLKNRLELQALQIDIRKEEKQHIEIENEIEDLLLQEFEEHENLLSDINKTMTLVHGEIQEWENKYVIVSPINGGINILHSQLENLKVTAGEEIVAIVPEKMSELAGFARVPMVKAGKVAEGQKVLVKVDNYPYKEYGYLRGKVKSITSVPDSGYYFAQVQFNEGTRTNYGYTLKIMQNMRGRAEIITRNQRIIERLFLPAKHFVNKQIAQ